MRRILAMLLAALLLPACALAEITMSEIQEGESTLVVFEAEADAVDIVPGRETALDAVQMAISAQIEARFQQEKAQQALRRAGAVVIQQGSVYQDGKIASMARTWQGEQADGTDGSSAAALTLSLETGMEIYMDELFADDEGAVAAMEAIIERDVLDGMSDYMEYADLLPMPTDSYSLDETGLTVYYPQERYRYFSGECGSVTFYWHELAEFIGEDSPVYALAHPDIPYNPGVIESQCMSGGVNAYMSLELGELLGNIAQWYDLADPDYTTDALVYPLERVRGFAVEIPKYAETAEEETPISAVRASRISFAGLLTTGQTTDADAIALLGEPAKETVFDEDAAFDAMLDPGTSLFYEIEGNVLQLHFDRNDVLACVILRDAMPQSLY